MSTAPSPPDALFDPDESCRLPEPDLEGRLAWIDREVAPHVVSTTPRPDGCTIELSAVPGLAERIDELIALEADCCSGMKLARTEPQGGRMQLEIRGVDPTSASLRSFVPSAPAPRIGRVLRSIGLGAGAGLVFCCVLPAAAVAIFGSGAAFLAGLDRPLPILAVGIACGALAWRRLR